LAGPGSKTARSLAQSPAAFKRPGGPDGLESSRFRAFGGLSSGRRNRPPPGGPKAPPKRPPFTPENR